MNHVRSKPLKFPPYRPTQKLPTNASAADPAINAAGAVTRPVSRINAVASSLTFDTPRSHVVVGDFEFPTMAQAWMRARPEDGNKGGDAARAVLALIQIKRECAKR